MNYVECDDWCRFLSTVPGYLRVDINNKVFASKKEKKRYFLTFNPPHTTNIEGTVA
jgi:hypothetical protein